MAEGYAEKVFVLELNDDELSYIKGLIEHAPEDELAEDILQAIADIDEEEN